MSLPTSDTRHRAYLSTRVFASLNGMRGLCIASVVWHHVCTDQSIVLLTRGFLGVDMFFVLSGFLIVTLLLREKTLTGSISLTNFYARRTLRIFPIYYLVLLSLFLLYLVFRSNTDAFTEYLRSLPFLVTYTSNWIEERSANMGIMWSLATEEQFYLVWPLIERSFPPFLITITLTFVIALNQLINFGFLDSAFASLYGHVPHLSILDTTFTPIALGAVLAHLLHEHSTFQVCVRFLAERRTQVFLVSTLLVLLALWPADLSGMGRVLIQVNMMLLLGTLVVREDNSLRSLLTLPPLAYLGTVSYGLYMYHMFVLHVIHALTDRFDYEAPPSVYFLLTLSLSTFVAGVSFAYIESPLLRLKSRFSGNRVLADPR